MRIKLCMVAEKDIMLPIAYNHILQKVIYDLLDDKYASKLHDLGYKYKNKVFKLFNYSKLVIENKTIKNNKIIIHKGKVDLTISSIDEVFIFKMINSLMDKKMLKFKEGVLNIQGIYSKNNLKGTKKVFLTISPVVVVQPERSSRTKFYNPKDIQFMKSIKNNILAKYAAFYNEEFKDELDISILDKNNIKKKIDRYKNWVYEGYLGGFIIEGDNKIINVAYSCGLGSKNSQGFGCIETFKNINNFRNYRKIF